MEEDVQKLNHYEIKRVGRLTLCYKTFIHRKAHNDEIEICMWNKDFDTRWTIASFEANDKESCYCIKSCCDRLNSENINWNDFGTLVLEGYKYLKNLEGLTSDNERSFGVKEED